MDTSSDLHDPAFDSWKSPKPSGTHMPGPARGFARFLYSSNPFYILSADLVFVGLRMSFGQGRAATRSWGLAIGLASYILLLATTACILIRIGRLWDDLRSLLLLIVILLLALAMSFDDTMAADPRRGALGYLAGFAFAVVVSELVLHTIQLRLSGWYRASYHAILALVFLYPISLVPVLDQPESAQLQWALFGFSPLAGLVLLPLVPAARGGAAAVAKNGSPWRWPLYPWSLFFLMAGAMGVRCYSLCVSFHYVGGSRTIFGPYFLVPIGLAMALIWLEIAIAGGRRGVMVVASLMPLAVVVLAMTGFRYEPIYLHFLDVFRQTLGGSPPFLALIGAAAFHAYAGARRAPLAWELLAIDLIALAAVGREARHLFDMAAIHSQPIAAAGLVLAVVSWRRRCSVRAAVAGGLLVIAIAQGCVDFWPHGNPTLVAVVSCAIALMTIGALFEDWLGQLARSAAWAVLVVVGIATAIHIPAIDHALPAGLILWSPLVVVSMTIAYGLLVGDRRSLPVAFASLTAWAGSSGFQSYQHLRRIVTGLDQLVWGLVFFVIAAAISFRKAGLWPRSGGMSASWALARLRSVRKSNGVE